MKKCPEVESDYILTELGSSSQSAKVVVEKCRE